MPVIVLSQEVTLAKKHFEDNWSYPLGCETWVRFMGGDLALDYDPVQSRFVRKMSERQAHIIRMLNGPHYKTILKMMAVQWTEGVEHE